MFIVLWGAFLRVLYFSVTPHDVRGYDTRGHIDYIIYVVRHFRIPPALLGWETHQPPLYYFLAGTWVKLGMLAGRATDLLSRDVRVLSLLLSIATLAVIAWIATILFPGKERRLQAWMFAAAAGTLPSIAMAASRVNNDVLSFFLSFLWLAFALRWWSAGRRRDFWIAAVILGLGVLTKFTAGILIVPMAGFILLRPRTGLTQKLLLLASLACVAGVLGGWYFIVRSLGYLESFVTTGTESFDPRVVLENRLVDFLIFNPAQIVLVPFAAPWDPLSGRQYIWEYLFRTGFFGEWTFPHLTWIGRIIVGLGLAGLLVGARDAVKTWRTWNFHKPLAVLMAFLLLMLALNRFIRPCACNQDFRLIPLIAVPFIAWAVHGWGTWGARGLRIGILATVSLMALQSLFLLSFLVA